MVETRIIEVKLRGKRIGGFRIAWDSRWDDKLVDEDMMWAGKLVWAVAAVKDCMSAIPDEMPVQPRFLLAIRLIVEALNDGKRDEKRESELSQVFFSTYGTKMFELGAES